MFSKSRPSFTAADIVNKSQGEQPQVAFFYGAPDSGKTTAAAKFSGKYNLIWFDIDYGFQAALNVIDPDRMGNVIVIRPKDDTMQATGYRTLSNIIDSDRWHKVCVDHGAVNCPTCTRSGGLIQEINLYATDINTILVIDSFTRLADSALSHASGVRKIDERKKMEYSDWDSQGLFLRNILNKAKQLPCHTIVISHEEEVKMPNNRTRIVPIAGTRANSRRISQFADHTIYFDVRNRKHVAYSTTTSLIDVQVGSNNNIELEKGDDITELFKPKAITDEVRARVSKLGSLTEEELAEVANQVELDGQSAEVTVKHEAPTKAARASSANSLAAKLAARKSSTK